MTENDKQEIDSSKLSNMNHLLKEYELCWHGIQHTNTRLWTSASIFLAGSIVALVKIVELPLSYGCWSQFFSVSVVSFIIIIVLFFYMFIFRSMILLDRIDILRSKEIEEELGLWRMRYHSFIYENPIQMNHDKENERKRLKTMQEEVIQRLGSSQKWFWTYKFATKSFKYIIRLIILVTLLYWIMALGITLGW